MSATLAPQGLVPSHHPSGVIRVTNQGDGIASAYGTSIYTGTPIMRGTDGTIIVVPTGASTPIGVFQGCEFSSASKRFVLPYWPAAQTYDAGSMIAKYTDDPEIIYEGQANGAVAMTAVGEGIDLGDASQGSVYTGFSTQSLAATTTGATAASFILQGLAPYPGNAWGDAYTRVYVKISTRQGQVA